jgi:hypothetical protein
MLQKTTLRLTELIHFLKTYKKTYVCNAIREHFYVIGFKRPDYITKAVRDEFYQAFPQEFDPAGQGFGVMDIWVTEENKQKFFGYSPEGRYSDSSFDELRDMRINFLTYLIETYGDVELTVQLRLLVREVEEPTPVADVAGDSEES